MKWNSISTDSHSDCAIRRKIDVIFISYIETITLVDSRYLYHTKEIHIRGIFHKILWILGPITGYPTWQSKFHSEYLILDKLYMKNLENNKLIKKHKIFHKYFKKYIRSRKLASLLE